VSQPRHTQAIQDKSLRFAVRVISLVIILIVLWALGILQTKGSVVY
jgi:type III secretory pathway component EscS